MKIAIVLQLQHGGKVPANRIRIRGKLDTRPAFLKIETGF